jgi:hypothetical protein
MPGVRRVHDRHLRHVARHIFGLEGRLSGGLPGMREMRDAVLRSISIQRSLRIDHLASIAWPPSTSASERTDVTNLSMHQPIGRTEIRRRYRHRCRSASARARWNRTAGTGYSCTRMLGIWTKILSQRSGLMQNGRRLDIVGAWSRAGNSPYCRCRRLVDKI